MSTKEFRTRTATVEIKNGLRVPGAWVIGLDVGYSSVKTTSANIYHSRFARYLRKRSLL